MKKLLTMLLAGALVLSLAACGGETTPEEMEEETAQPTTESVEPAAEEESATPEEDGGTLIAYFSWSGNTEQVAQIIAEETGGTLFEIAPAVPYTDDYDELLDIARQEQSEGARPELAAQVENWDSYDTVFVGYPNWWSDAPMAVYTFLEAYDWTGKALVPFNTSASGGFGRSLDGLAESAAGADILDGISFTSSTLSDAQSEVPAWLDSLALD